MCACAGIGCRVPELRGGSYGGAPIVRLMEEDGLRYRMDFDTIGYMLERMFFLDLDGGRIQFN